MLVSYVAGERVELTVHKKSVVAEEIKEVELRSRRVQFIYDSNYNRIGLQPRGHAPSRLSVKKKYPISYYSSEFTINAQPRCRNVSSHSVLF